MKTETTQREAVVLHRLVRRFCVLADIPNQEGFRFIGKDHDGELIPCIVKKDPVGCHGAYDERDGSPCFFRLEAWSEYSANKEFVVACAGTQRREGHKKWLNKRGIEYTDSLA